MRSLARGSGAQVGSTVASLGGALAQGALSDVLARNERDLNAAMGAGSFVLAAILARFPKALAWPLSTVLALAGATWIARALRLGRHPQRG